MTNLALNQETNKPLTFNPEGLSELAINILKELDKIYFSGGDIYSTDTLLTAAAIHGVLKGKFTDDLLEAWNYYKVINRPLIRESYIQSVNLSELLTENKDINPGGCFHIWTVLNKSYKPTEKLINILSDGGLIYPLSPQHYYFDIINDCLYIKYQTIIGSRMIAFINNDLTTLENI